MNDVKKKNCIICGKEFECNSKNMSGHKTPVGRRRSNSITCSKKCSIIYANVRCRVMTELRLKQIQPDIPLSKTEGQLKNNGGKNANT